MFERRIPSAARILRDCWAYIWAQAYWKGICKSITRHFSLDACCARKFPLLRHKIRQLQKVLSATQATKQESCFRSVLSLLLFSFHKTNTSAFAIPNYRSPQILTAQSTQNPDVDGSSPRQNASRCQMEQLVDSSRIHFRIASNELKPQGGAASWPSYLLKPFKDARLRICGQGGFDPSVLKGRSNTLTKSQGGVVFKCFVQIDRSEIHQSRVNKV